MWRHTCKDHVESVFRRTLSYAIASHVSIISGNLVSRTLLYLCPLVFLILYCKALSSLSGPSRVYLIIVVFIIVITIVIVAVVIKVSERSVRFLVSVLRSKHIYQVVYAIYRRWMLLPKHLHL
jgi:hypothetical protein